MSNYPPGWDPDIDAGTHDECPRQEDIDDRNTALELIEADPHQWSKRPCATCNKISELIERPFGCEKARRG